MLTNVQAVGRSEIGDGFDAVGAADLEDVRPYAARQSVVTRAPVQAIVAGTSFQVISAPAPVHQIPAILTEDPIVAPTEVFDCDHEVVTGAQPHDVVAAAAVHTVIAGTRLDQVVAIAGVQGVGVGAANERVASVAAVQQVATGAAL